LSREVTSAMRGARPAAAAPRASPPPPCGIPRDSNSNVANVHI
jgi:hypothetical protein